VSHKPANRRPQLALVATAAVIALACTRIGADAGRASPAPSTERVYEASLAYAECMRAHGVPQPDPDRSGDIHLTVPEERAMRRVGRAKVRAADKICFALHLKGVVSTKPLSPWAQARAIDVLKQLAACLRGYGYVEGKPVVRNMSEGRAFFGFASGPRPRDTKDRQRMMSAQHICENRVELAKRIDAIIKADRGPV
jgi:hypothetical protein